MTYIVYKDNYIILEASTSPAVDVDLDLLFDRFRWAELSLGFASTGNSFNEEISLGLWELNDATCNIIEEQQVIQMYVNVRSRDERLPLRQLFSVWDLALPASMLSNLWSITMKGISGSAISLVQRNPLPDFYSQHSFDDVDKGSWASSVASIDRVLSQHQATEQWKIAVSIGGKKTREEKFYAEGFRPAIISSGFESFLGNLPLGGRLVDQSYPDMSRAEAIILLIPV